MRRLLLPALLACALFAGPAAAEWSYTTKTDGVFAETRYIATTETRAGDALWVSCYHHVRSDEWRLGVGLRLANAAALPPGPVAVTWRFDDGAEHRDTWEALRHGGLIAANEADLLARLRAAGKFTLAAGETGADFDLAAKADALAKVEAECARENGARQ